MRSKVARASPIPEEATAPTRRQGARDLGFVQLGKRTPQKGRDRDSGQLANPSEAAANADSERNSSPHHGRSPSPSVLPFNSLLAVQPGQHPAGVTRCYIRGCAITAMQTIASVPPRGPSKHADRRHRRDPSSVGKERARPRGSPIALHRADVEDVISHDHDPTDGHRVGSWLVRILGSWS